MDAFDEIINSPRENIDMLKAFLSDPPKELSQEQIAKLEEIAKEIGVANKPLSVEILSGIK